MIKVSFVLFITTDYTNYTDFLLMSKLLHGFSFISQIRKPRRAFGKIRVIYGFCGAKSKGFNLCNLSNLWFLLLPKVEFMIKN